MLLHETALKLTRQIQSPPENYSCNEDIMKKRFFYFYILEQFDFNKAFVISDLNLSAYLCNIDKLHFNQESLNLYSS